MTLLEEKHFDVLVTNGLSYVELSKECAKITLQHCIDVLNECMQTMKDAGYNKHINATFIPEATIVGLKKQLSDLNK